jgi:hypothetical protein
MQKEEITAFVIEELGKHHSRNEIIRRLCERTGIIWPDAEKLVKQVEADHGQDIRARQSPLLIALGVAIFIGGIGLVLYCAIYFIGYFQSDALYMVSRGRNAIYAIGALFTGIGMIAGAVIGLWRTIQELFEDKENR